MEQQINQHRQFLLGSISDDRLQNKILDYLPILEDHLNQNIRLADYDWDITNIYFCPIFLPQPDHIHEEERRYDAQEQDIWIQAFVDMDHLQGAPEAAFIRIMGDVLVRELQQMKIVPKELISEIEKVLGRLG